MLKSDWPLDWIKKNTKSRQRNACPNKPAAINVTGICNASPDVRARSHCTGEPCRLTVNKNWSRFRIRWSIKGQRESHSPHERTRRLALKRQRVCETPGGLCAFPVCVCRSKLYGCAITPNRFLVAPLFHYLIRKDFPPFHWVSTPSFFLPQMLLIHDIVCTLHTGQSYWIHLFYLIVVALFSPWGLGVKHGCCGTGRLIVLGSPLLMFSTLGPTHDIFPIFSSRR